MDLKTYLEQNNISYREFGTMIGVDHSQVSRWIRGHRLPSLPMAVAIEKATGGQVMPADFVKGDAT